MMTKRRRATKQLRTIKIHKTRQQVGGLNPPFYSKGFPLPHLPVEPIATGIHWNMGRSYHDFTPLRGPSIRSVTSGPGFKENLLFIRVATWFEHKNPWIDPYVDPCTLSHVEGRSNTRRLKKLSASEACHQKWFQPKFAHTIFDTPDDFCAQIFFDILRSMAHTKWHRSQICIQHFTRVLQQLAVCSCWFWSTCRSIQPECWGGRFERSHTMT